MGGVRRLAVASAAAFFVLVALVAVGALRSADLAATPLLQRPASAPLDIVANWNTVAGQGIVSAAAAALLAVVLWRRGLGVSAAAPALLLATAAIELLLKLTLPQTPPPDAFKRTFIEPLVRVPTPFSFPSGHVARVTFLAVFAWHVFPAAAARAALAAFCAFTLFARVYIGDHWLSDALGGLALGLAVGAVAVGWTRRAATTPLRTRPSRG
ncbi:hypothetical protein BH18CHL2_BH18CHL2_10700 [soil metagenome]